MQDLLKEDSREEDRHAALALMTAVAVSSNASNRFGGAMRHIMFNYVEANYEKENVEYL